VGDAGAAFDVVGADLVHQLGHACGAAGTLQAARATQTGRVHGNATGVITPVFEPLQALHQDGNDVAGRNGADDATHEDAPEQGNGGYLRIILKKYPII
jgi:predicted HD phosphohydrolase